MRDGEYWCINPDTSVQSKRTVTSVRDHLIGNPTGLIKYYNKWHKVEYKSGIWVIDMTTANKSKPQQ